MPVDVVMPKLGLTMEEGLIVEWKVKEGDEVKKGDILFVLETEKVTYDVEAPEDGVLGLGDSAVAPGISATLSPDLRI